MAMTTETFEPFLRLPPELQLQIWSNCLNPLSIPPQSFKLDSACLGTIHCLRFECLSGLEEAISGAGSDNLSTPGGAVSVVSEARLARRRQRGCQSYYQALMMWKYTRSHWTDSAEGPWSDGGETTRCHKVLMNTTRMSRKVVLERWRTQIEEINVQEAEGEAEEVWRREAVKVEVLEVLETLIRKL